MENEEIHVDDTSFPFAQQAAPDSEAQTGLEAGVVDVADMDADACDAGVDPLAMEVLSRTYGTAADELTSGAGVCHERRGN